MTSLDAARAPEAYLPSPELTGDSGFLAIGDVKHRRRADRKGLTQVRSALLLLFAALPLQWLLIPGLPMPTGRVHVLAIVVFAAVVFLRHRARTLVPVLSVAWPFLGAMTALLMVWFAVSLYHGEVPRSPVQEAAQLVAFVAVGTVVYRAARYPSSGVLDAARWTALVCSVSLVTALSISMALNGVDAVSVFSQTVSQGNPEILERQLFRSAFTGFGYDAEVVRGNIRHEMLGAVLTSMYLSVAAVRLRPFGSRAQLRIFQASMVLGALLLLISLSRSVVLAALAWPLLAIARSFLNRTVTTRQLALTVGAGVVLVLGAATGFLSVIWVRFAQDTASYDTRGDLLGRALDNIANNLVTGGVDTVQASSHNFVLDTWLRTGVLGAVAALLVMVVLLGLWIVLITRIGVEPDWMLPVTAALALPIARMFTAGGGVIPPVQWVGLGIVAGFLAYRAFLIADARRSHLTRPDAVAAERGG